MKFRYDEDLVESAVFLCASGKPRSVPALQVTRFHRERERLYRILDPDERNTAFYQLHLEWFREWGLESQLLQVLREFPLLDGALQLLAFRKARGQKDEGAELYVNEAAVCNAVVALRPDRFARAEDLTIFLRHEFMHLHDMVDPAFGYVPELPLAAANLSQQQLARERYRLLWDITIDGRLTASGRVPIANREQHWKSFARAYSFWPEEKQASVFDLLWQRLIPCHADLCALATDPCDLSQAHQPLPGAACPLCGFSTFKWADGASLSPWITDAITAGFAHWTPTQGLCQRCAEIYEVAVKSAQDNRPAPAVP